MRDSITVKRSASANRAFELDVLRGVAIVMMMFMHFSYDVRYEFGVDTFNYLHSAWFWEFIHPIIIVLFVGISGICCSFSRNNLKRGLKLLAVALAFTFGTLFVTKVMNIYCLILFNVLHMLSISTLTYAFIVYIAKKLKLNDRALSFILGFIGIYIMMLNNNLNYYDNISSNLLLMPLGISVIGEPSVADFMPLIPWLGVFLAAAAIGREVYPDKNTLFPNVGAGFHKAMAPLGFLGRHSLIVYIIHQPIIYAVLYLIFKLLGKV